MECSEWFVLVGNGSLDPVLAELAGVATFVAEAQDMLGEERLIHKANQKVIQ